MHSFDFDHKGELLFDEPLSKHTTFRTGGNARALLLCENISDIKNAVSWAKANGVRFYILGNGSNTIAPDSGYDGLIIKLGKAFSEITVNGCEITACAGALLPKVASTALENSLTGFEFACGIPGSVGGALTMNAGAYGGEMSHIVKSARLIRSGEVIEVTKDELDLSYRHSALMGTDDIITDVTYTLNKGDKDLIKQKMDELKAAREQKQPVELPSAGSTFKRPEGYFAAALIDECDLKGRRIGGAEVSKKHAGFIVNIGGATTGDIIALIDAVKEEVYNKKGVMLEPEVRFI
ncbi:MAG: UDP-N-acetylmuramate dehydrogenase [Clostridia bacterium]|nr:UDP-N-acetylmuramate dehydrogenase [Clostridia bacterium]